MHTCVLGFLLDLNIKPINYGDDDDVIIIMNL